MHEKTTDLILVGVRPEDLHKLPNPKPKVVGDTTLVWINVPNEDGDSWLSYGTAWYVWPGFWYVGGGGKKIRAVHHIYPMFVSKVDFVAISPWEGCPDAFGPGEYKGRVPAALRWEDWLTLAPLVGTVLADQSAVLVHDNPTEAAWEELYQKAMAHPQPPEGFKSPRC